MKKLTKKIFLLGMLILTFIGPVAVANKISYVQKLNSTAFKLAPDINTLIIGDSHAEKSLDPSLIPGSKNISLGAESIFYTYYKLKHFIDMNPGAIHNVVLSFSYHNFSKKYQDDYLFDDDKSAHSFKKYFIYLNRQGQNNIVASNNFITYYLKYNFGIPLMEYNNWRKLKLLYELPINRLRGLAAKQPNNKEIEGFGGFDGNDSSNLDKKKIMSKIKLYYLDNNAQYSGYSQIMLDSLENIASLCAENNIKLYLFNAPLHTFHRRLIPTSAFDKYDSEVKSLKSRHPNVIQIDLSTEVLDNSYYQDGDHVNNKGAKVVSSKLYRMLYDLPPSVNYSYLNQ